MRSKDSRRTPGTQAARHFHVACRHRRQLKADTDEELALEDGQRLILTELLEIGGRRPDDLLDGHAWRSIDGQFGGDQIRIARLVRLRVQPFGYGDFQADADRGRAGRAGLC
mgnify:CR=1 FL=1